MKTSKSSWKEPLSKLLRKNPRTAFVGIGQELRGDDAAGVLVVRRLMELTAGIRAKRTESQPCEGPLFFEAGSLPESAAGSLRRYRPDWVVLIDAADMGEAVGAIRWLDPLQVEGFSRATHAIPLSGFADYLSSELGCRVAVLGIQSKTLEFDSALSEEVRRAIEEIAACIVGNSMEKGRPAGHPIRGK